jgi:Kef-type K+ transport system membrane component KefB
VHRPCPPAPTPTVSGDALTGLAEVSGALVLAVAPAPAPDLDSLVLVLAASVLGALLSRVHRAIVLPTVVVEIVLGIVIGPEVLNIASVDAYIDFLAGLGLVALFFFAGIEVVEQRVARRSLVRGGVGWAISVAIGLTVGIVLHAAGLDAEWWLVGIALSTTALGTLVPILGDAGLLRTPLGSAVLGTGVAGEFWPIVVISVFLTGVYGATTEVILLIGFGVVVLLFATAALRMRPPRLVQILQETIHTTGQAAVRLALLLLGALVLLASDVGFDAVLGAFAAGLIVGLILDTPEGAVVRMRLEGIGFGFLVPIYFVATGMTFALNSLLTGTGLGLAAVFLGLMLVVRGSSALLWLRELGGRATTGLALFAATGLPLIVAIVDIGTERGAVTTTVGTALVGAGMISVLVFPLVATRILGRTAAAPAEPIAPEAAG